MGGFSIWHILIFAVLVLLLFGGNRFSAMMGDVVGSSRVDLQACKLEYSIVSPK